MGFCFIIFTMVINGLSNKEVNERKEKGLVNKTKTKIYKTHFQIFKDSFLSFYNIILYGVALSFLLYQVLAPNGIKDVPLTKYGFLIIVLINGLISFFSEERSKRTIEKLNIIEAKKVNVIRDNKEINIDSTEIVIDDVLILDNGELVQVDLIILNGIGEFNESVLSGESNLIIKGKGDKVFAGSTYYGERMLAKAIAIGDNTYLKQLENKVKSIKKDKSKLNRDINRIIKYMTLLMIPSFFIVLLKQFYIGDGINHFVFTSITLIKSATIIIGMIPIGLVFLSSITLANSIYKLTKDEVLCKELYGIESLARISYLALDKTGTITDNKITLSNYKFFNEIDDFHNLFSFYLSEFSDNLTSLALKEEFNKFIYRNYKIKDKLNFDSKNKYSSLSINGDTYKLGAYEVIINDKDLMHVCELEAKKGFRVMAFSKNDVPICYFTLENKVKDSVKETIEYFKGLNVNILIISGDNEFTIKSISSRIGFDEEVINLMNKSDEEVKELALKYHLFARATPSQKEIIIESIENSGNRCAYIGDGINDITSLKRASCSISFKSASSSAREVSDLILLDDDFIHLKKVIKEGRRVINNVKRSCSLFVSKDILLSLLALYSLFNLKGLFIEIESLYIFEFITVAFSGFLLSIENNNYDRVEEFILSDILKKGLVNGFYLSLSGLLLLIINYFYKFEHFEIIYSLLLSITSPFILFTCFVKQTRYDKGVVIVCFSLTLLLLIGLPNLFLDTTYLKTATNIHEQINLIFNCLFNLSFYKALNLSEWIFIIIYLTIVPTSFLLIFYKVIKKKLN